MTVPNLLLGAHLFDRWLNELLIVALLNVAAFVALVLDFVIVTLGAAFRLLESWPIV